MSRRDGNPYCDFCEKPDGPFVSGGKDEGYHICQRCIGLAAEIVGIRVDLGNHAPLTKKQMAIYRYLVAFIDTHGYAPSLDEIAAAFSYRSIATVHEHLTHLQRKCWISRDGYRARSLACLVKVKEAA